MLRNRLVVIGQVGKPIGIRGEIRVKPFTRSLEVFERSSILVLDDSAFRVVGLRKYKGSPIISFEGIDTPEKARELGGCLVRTHAENLPPKDEGEYYWFELIGMRVHSRDGRDLGTVTTIIETGANDVLQVEGKFGEILLPMIDQVVLEVDTQSGEMLVDPLEGLIPEH